MQLSLSDPHFLIAVVVSIVVSLVVHEFMHAWAGHLLGDTTAQHEGRLTLNPLAHIDLFMTVILPVITLVAFGAPVLAAKPVPFNPDRVKYDEFGAAIIAAAGPFSNLLLAVIAAFAASAVSASHPGLRDVLMIFTTLNVALFVFNLVPIPPLDGSRVLYAFAPDPVRNFMEAIEPYGLFLIFGLILIGNFGQFIYHIDQSILNLLPG